MFSNLSTLELILYTALLVAFLTYNTFYSIIDRLAHKINLLIDYPVHT